MREFYVPTLEQKGAWKEITDASKGGADWRGHRYYANISKIAAHHTVTHPLGNWEKEVDVIRQIHMVTNGWGGIGYNFIITTQESNGYAIVAKIGSLSSIRAHTPNSKGVAGIPVNYGNYYIVGISMIGMLHLTNPTDAQLRSFHELAKELIYREDARMPKLKDWNDLMCHKDFDATACPGNWAYQRPRIINPPAIVTPPPVDPCADEIKKATDPLNAKIKTLNTTIAGLNAKIKEKDIIIGEQTDVISGLKDQIKDINEEHAAKLIEVEKQHQLDLEEKDGKIKQLTEDYATLYTEFEKLKGMYDDLMETCRWEQPNSVTEWFTAFLAWLRKHESKTPEATPPADESLE